jgi:hypothetical protein
MPDHCDEPYSNFRIDVILSAAKNPEWLGNSKKGPLFSGEKPEMSFALEISAGFFVAVLLRMTYRV